MSYKDRFDLLVIGGGILGTFHAFHAVQMGLKVGLFEKDAAPQSASVRNFGQIVPSGMSPRWQTYGRRGLEIYKDIQAGFDISLKNNGSYYLASDEEELQLLEELAAINIDQDYPSELLSAEACVKKLPALRKEYCKGGLFFPEEISLNPRIAVHQLLKYLGTFENFAYFPATGIISAESDTSGVKLVDIFKQTYFASKVVICSGSEFRLIFPEIFADSDLEVTKLQMALIGPQQKVQIPGNILTGLSIRRYESFRDCPSYQEIKSRETDDSFWKEWGIHILFKQENDGSIILGDSHEYSGVSGEDNFGFDLKKEICDYFVAEGKKIFNLEHWNITHQWYGIYSQCREKDIFQRTIDKHIHIATGIGGKGMTGSPGFAEENINKIFNHD